MTSAREALEELLELLWTAEEDGLSPVPRAQLPMEMRCFTPSPIEFGEQDWQAAVDQAIAKGWVTVAAPGRVALSAEGKTQAAPIVRRHRLTESLLAGVLHVSDPSVESTACQAEHILNEEVTDAVCIFLGHPPVCPHQRAIPRGHCCDRALPPTEPLIVPIAQLSDGEEGRIAFIHTRRPRHVQRLSLAGLVPGTRVRLRRSRPMLVMEVGQSEFALDRESGEEIYVRRQPQSSGGARPSAP